MFDDFVKIKMDAATLPLAAESLPLPFCLFGSVFPWEIIGGTPISVTYGSLLCYFLPIVTRGWNAYAFVERTS